MGEVMGVTILDVLTCYFTTKSNVIDMNFLYNFRMKTKLKVSKYLLDILLRGTKYLRIELFEIGLKSVFFFADFVKVIVFISLIKR